MCLLDGLCCYEPPHLQKLMSADSFAHIDSVLVLHCSTPLLARLQDHFALFNTVVYLYLLDNLFIYLFIYILSYIFPLIPWAPEFHLIPYLRYRDRFDFVIR